MLVKFRIKFVVPDQVIVDVFDVQDNSAIFAASFAVFKLPNLSVWHFR